MSQMPHRLARDGYKPDFRSGRRQTNRLLRADYNNSTSWESALVDMVQMNGSGVA